MGWTGDDEPRHINDVINDQLHMLRASEVHVSNETVSRYRQALNKAHQLGTNLYSLLVEPIQVWFIAPSQAQVDQPTFAGVILVESEENDVINDPQTLTRIWRWNITTVNEGPYYYDCPASFLQTAHAAGKLREQHGLEYLQRWSENSPQSADITPELQALLS